MKIQFMLLCMLYVAIDGAVIVPYAVAPFTDLSNYDKADLAYLRDYARPKRSGSGDILNHLKSSIGQGIKSKLGQFAKGSASASSHFSGGGGYHGSSYHHHHGHSDYGKFDVWSFKKSVLYTLLQAVKAIKGGVIAIKGQLIKGGGQLLQTKGKIIKGGGEVLTNVGKALATSAFMIIPEHDHGHEEEHYEYAAPVSYGHSGPEYDGHGIPSGHGGPSGPGVEYGPPGYLKHGHNSVYDGKDGHHHDGIVILKKIPTGHSDHEGHETHTPPDFKPISDSVSYSILPSVKNIVGSMFSASSSSSSSSSSDEHHSPPTQYASPSVQVHTKQNSVPSTSYGTPIGNPVKYMEYFNKAANTLSLNPLKNVEMFVTPTPVDDPPKTDTPHQNEDQYYKLELPKAESNSNHHTQVNGGHYFKLGPTKSESEVNQNQNVQLNDGQYYKLEIPHNNELQNAANLYKLDLPKPQQSEQHSSNILIGMHFPLENLEHHIQNQMLPYRLPTAYPQQVHTQQVQTPFLIHIPDPTELIAHDSTPQSSKLKKEHHSHKQHKKPPKNFEIVRSVGFELRPNGRPIKI